MLKILSTRARYLAFHIPLDDRLSVLLTNQYNYRLNTVGHISFWSPASALTLLTASGLQPLSCYFTKGVYAPSSRLTLLQKIAFPVRAVITSVSPGLAAMTVGGVSLAVLCRGRLP
jgi:hypothetical protein